MSKIYIEYIMNLVLVILQVQIYRYCSVLTWNESLLAYKLKWTNNSYSYNYCRLDWLRDMWISSLEDMASWRNINIIQIDSNMYSKITPLKIFYYYLLGVNILKYFIGNYKRPRLLSAFVAYFWQRLQADKMNTHNLFHFRHSKYIMFWDTLLMEYSSHELSPKKSHILSFEDMWSNIWNIVITFCTDTMFKYWTFIFYNTIIVNCKMNRYLSKWN